MDDPDFEKMTLEERMAYARREALRPPSEMEADPEILKLIKPDPMAVFRDPDPISPLEAFRARGGESAPKPRSLDYAAAISEEDFERLVEENDVDPRAAAARFRSHRAHMMKRLKRRFELYTPFTIQEAADRCGLHLREISGYLEFESRLAGSLIERIEDKFMIVSVFG